MNQNRRWGLALVISLFLPIMGLVLPFVQFYLLNTANLTLPLTVHLPQLAMVCGLTAAALFALQAVIPAPVRTTVTALLLAWGIGIWAETTLLIGNFGFLQGEDLDWAANRHLLYLEIALAGALLLVLVRWRKQLVARAGLVMLVLLVSSLANLYGPWQASRGRNLQPMKHTFTREGLFSLSAKQNVLLFIVDTFQSDVFAGLVTADESWQNKLDGFTYFPDAVSDFPKTYASVPSILTGRAFDNSQPFARYLRRSYLDDSLPVVLKQEGFDVRFRSFSWQPYLADPRVADNLADIESGDSPSWMQQREGAQILNLVLFRLAPYLLKPTVYNDNQFLIKVTEHPKGDVGNPYALNADQKVYSRGNRAEDLAFLDQALAFLTADSQQPALRVMHLQGAHVPLNIDRNLNVVPARNDDPRAVQEQSEAMLKLLDLVFARLKELDLYDQSLILVVGDHGAGENFQLDIDGSALGKLGLDRDFEPTGDSHLQEVVRGGIPLVLAKPVKSRGRLSVSEAPVSLSDVPATVFDQLGLPDVGHGQSIFQIDPGQPRPRYHRFYRFAGWGQDYIVPLKEYLVDGFSWDPAAWKLSGRNLNLAAVKSSASTLVVLGEGGNLDDYPHRGWSAPLLQGRQVGPSGATVSFRLPGGSGPVTVAFTLKQTDDPQVPAPFSLLANGHALATWTIDNAAARKLTCVVPANLIGDEGVLNLEFRQDPTLFPDPEVVDISLDFATSYPDYALGQVIDFGIGKNSRPYLQADWIGAESWGAWVNGFVGSVAMKLDQVPPEGLEIAARMQAAVFPGSDPVQVDLLINGAPLEQFVMSGPELVDGSWWVPSELVPPTRELDLTFRVANPRTPAEFGINDDRRPLGLGLASLVVRPAPADLPDRLNSRWANRILVDGPLPDPARGLHQREQWGHGQAVWTSGAGRFSWTLDHVDPQVLLQVEALDALTPRAQAAVVVGGELVLSAPARKFPWLISQPVDPGSDGGLDVVIYSTTLNPDAGRRGTGDDRDLGLALARVQLLPMGDGPTSSINPAPRHAQLTPGLGPRDIWTGLQDTGDWAGYPVTWTDGLARCRAVWSGQQAPRHLLLDLAATCPEGSSLQVMVGDRVICEQDQVQGPWGRLLPLPRDLKPGPVDITIRSSTFVPGGGDTRTLGVALARVMLLE